ncbi:bifunctional transcriptional activator/DNA repair enzyme AdaA [Kiloniella sp. b19]|uniref:bifunctional transcriptional activator/DNA repair enzyme AdaA n=1 Tax=Kiloniella sp. GXU_MW_B19 TaxID=3141326 RepID=UPI0031D48F04
MKASLSQALPKSRKDLVLQICSYLEEQEGEVVSLTKLGEIFGYSPWHLQRIFRKALGVSPRDYGEALRSDRFRKALRQCGSVTEALYEAGYASSSRAYENALGHLGMTPSSYARGGEGARMNYGIAACPANFPEDHLLVAATDKGLCFLALGTDQDTLVRELHDEFPNASEIQRNQTATEPALQTVLDYLAGTLPHPELPLDVQGTAFQYRVWQALMAIPAGETRSYQELAETLGIPKASRAVARACATNPVALIIPCHRIIGSNDSLTGYRWGVQRKKALLDQEAIQLSDQAV